MNTLFLLSRNKIRVKTLDLNMNFSGIAAQLNAIVAEHWVDLFP